MRVHTQPAVEIVPVGPIATATYIEIRRGSSSTIRSVDAALPKNNADGLSEDQIRRELVVRAWISGTQDETGGTPILLLNPSFISNVNGSAGIYARTGRIYVGRVDETETGYVVWYGPNPANAPNSIEISHDQLLYPSPEDALESAIPNIAAMLATLNPHDTCDTGVTVLTAERLYPAIVDLVAGYSFPYISF